ncbi:MAG: hypothetical protein OJJ21_03240 [Ferrovibrio sp.]|uniref:hypothetical protein n=1 Tax=Ferrovibrio sp. TaxID=1917215 RepID=UPI00260FD861|nr:hypothetical protein [Ferrovibrio sp.]MCW0232593.1 hypothetical protein [Ferrovibrio sp.]
MGQNLIGKSPRDIKIAEVAAVMESQYHSALTDRRPPPVVLPKQLLKEGLGAFSPSLAEPASRK